MNFIQSFVAIDVLTTLTKTTFL